MTGRQPPSAIHQSTHRVTVNVDVRWRATTCNTCDGRACCQRLPFAMISGQVLTDRFTCRGTFIFSSFTILSFLPYTYHSWSVLVLCDDLGHVCVGHHPCWMCELLLPFLLFHTCHLLPLPRPSSSLVISFFFTLTSSFS